MNEWINEYHEIRIRMHFKVRATDKEGISNPVLPLSNVFEEPTAIS